MLKSLSLILLLCLAFGNLGAIDHKTVTATVDGLHIRSTPALSGGIRGKLNKDETAVLIGRSTFSMLVSGKNSYWYKVRGPRGSVGWVFGGYITIDGEAPISRLQMKWVTECHDGPGELTFVEKSQTSAQAVASLDNYCISLESKDSDFETHYFSPISEQHRLHLYIAGLDAGPGAHELQIEYRLRVPVCRECDGVCRRLHEISTVRESLQFTHDFSKSLVVALADGPIEDWRLMGLSATARLYAQGVLRGIREITLPGWPWCA